MTLAMFLLYAPSKPVPKVLVFIGAYFYEPMKACTFGTGVEGGDKKNIAIILYYICYVCVHMRTRVCVFI